MAEQGSCPPCSGQLGFASTVWQETRVYTFKLAKQQQRRLFIICRGEDLGLGPEKVRREIQLQARLSHVNIVELKQVLLTRKHLGIVMTYEAGGDLHSYATKYKMDETVVRLVNINPATDILCHTRLQVQQAVLQPQTVHCGSSKTS